MAPTKKVQPQQDVTGDVPVEDLPHEQFTDAGLAEAATQAMADVLEGDGAQPAFDGLEDVTKVKFTGMAFDSVDGGIKLGDEVVFLVRARCTAETKEVMKTGSTRDVRRMEVTSVVVHNG